MTDGKQRRYRFTRWSSRVTEVAGRLEFTAGGGLAFWDGDRLELAVRAGDWNNLQEVSRRPGNG